MSTAKRLQRGAVSLFIVIFAALLIVTIVTAFVRIMLQDQQQATTSDLAKSALDSAQAGVEDAKRAIVEYYQRNCPNTAAGVNTRCDTLHEVLFGNLTAGGDGWTSGCQVTVAAGVATLTDNEVPVKTNTADNDLDQAYTCIKVQMNPVNYIGSDVSKLIKLQAKDNAPFSKIKVQWYMQQDDEPLQLDDGTSQNYQLPDTWPERRPQLMRLQLLQYGADFKLTDFDSDYRHNATLFLLPTSVPGLTTATFASDFRKSSSSLSTQKVGCNPEPTIGSYACEMIIDLPDIGTPPGATPRNAYLKVDQLYASGSKRYSITMLDATGEPVRFSDVQVAVDATGRASDLFKRVQSRIDIGGGVPTPDAAVDVTRSLCKEFLVTDTTAYPGNNTICPVPPTNP